MSVLNHKYGRYLLLIPIVIMAVASIYFSRVTAEIDKTLLAEKRLEKRLEIDLIADQIDAFIAVDNDWYTYSYEPIIANALASLDALPYTFAALYDGDLNSLSSRTPSYNPLFEPMLGDDAFIEQVMTNPRGEYVMQYVPEGDAARNMYIYYRWIPTDSSLSGRYLAVIAVSSYSVTNRIADWVSVGAIALIAVVTILNSVLVILLSYLGCIYGKRRGGKHRGAL